MYSSQHTFFTIWPHESGLAVFLLLCSGHSSTQMRVLRGGGGGGEGDGRREGGKRDSQGGRD